MSLAVREKDGVVFAFDDEGEDNAVNGLIVTFINKSDAPTGKLVVSAKNSVWADFAYGNFTNLFGTYYDDWEKEGNF